jgi:probable phosphoglycerate mutase
MPFSRLWLIRHGETDWNATGRIQGQTPTDLNANGRRQAETLAGILKRTERRFVACYSSDLPRAYQTAQAIAATLGLDIQKNVQLRERSFGPLEGATSRQIKARREELGLTHSGDLADWTGFPGVETNDALWTRTKAALEAIAAAHVGVDVLVVTHGGVIARAIYQTLQIPDNIPRRFPLSNGIVAVIEARPTGMYLLSLADMSFLQGLPDAGDTSRVTSAD